MSAALWFTIAGLLLVGFALASSTIKRLPLTTAILYLCVGVVLGPHVSGLVTLDPLRDAALLEKLTEVAVIVSLFSAGLKLRVPLRHGLWSAAIRLASLSMAITVGLIAVTAVYLLGMSWGAAVLLGGILAPTDPVLASDVQVGHPFDRDRLRFGLTGEAGLNDGTAFAFVLLGLSLLGLHDLGSGAWHWIAVDIVWGIAGGLLIGAALGTLLGHTVLHLRRGHRQTAGADDFIAFGLIALSYGLALLCHTYGFLAVFAAGLALRRVEMRETRSDDPIHAGRIPGTSLVAGDVEAAVDPAQAPAYLAEAVRHVTMTLERVGEIVVVMIVGALLSWSTVTFDAAALAVVLLVVIRPISVLVGLAGGHLTVHELRLAAWFGIRGIGSIYYLMYAIHRGIPDDLARQLVAITLTTVAISTFLHGGSVTTLMSRHGRK
jgi:NhaP-type Na+/H+ or K+/H+ antiporter